MSTNDSTPTTPADQEAPAWARHLSARNVIVAALLVGASSATAVYLAGGALEPAAANPYPTHANSEPNPTPGLPPITPGAPNSADVEIIDCGTTAVLQGLAEPHGEQVIQRGSARITNATDLTLSYLVDLTGHTADGHHTTGLSADASNVAPHTSVVVPIKGNVERDNPFTDCAVSNIARLNTGRASANA